jgi:hypothetical protein
LTDNVITVYAKDQLWYKASALRVNSFENLVVSGGTYEANNEGNNGLGIAFHPKFADGDGSSFIGVTFKSDNYLVGTDNDTPAPLNWTFNQCVFVHTGDGATFWGNFHKALLTGWVFLDCTFTNCDPRNIDSLGATHDVEDCYIKWTITLRASANAAYSCEDQHGTVMASGFLDGDGRVELQLPEVTLGFIDATELTNHVEHNDYTITIDGTPKQVTVDSTKTVEWP